VSHPLYVVDVFAERKWAGNQLAVVADADDLSDDEMQAVAREMAYSETTFVEGHSGDGWDVRIFTPEAEVPFAGHPTLGTAHVIREHLADDPGEETVLDLMVGAVPVRLEETDGVETLWMTQQPPEFGSEVDRGLAASVLGYGADALADGWPVQVVSTGLPTVVVPLPDREALTGVELDREAYDELVAATDAQLVHAFCPDPRDDADDYAVRMFAPGLGVREDPATGSANGCLAAYLARHGEGAVDARVEQGYELDRPSLLHLRAEEREEGVRVEVGGGVVPTVEGDLL
jgi:trans-2,3-dihydro-3-hydroxyanthranilate isomerase